MASRVLKSKAEFIKETTRSRENTRLNKPHVKRGLWKLEEDLILKNYVETHGEGNWAVVSQRSGLMRGGKSCRLRWKNYLRPNIKRGGMSEEEEDLIIRMHKLLGNRWSLIAGRLPGRTDNEVKNYWNTHLNNKCRLGKQKIMDSRECHDENDEDNKNSENQSLAIDQESVKGRPEGVKRKKEDRVTNTCMDDISNSFIYELEASLMPTTNTESFYSDDDPFIALLGSSGCNNGDETYSQFEMGSLLLW